MGFFNSKTPREMTDILSDIEAKANELQTRVDFDQETKTKNEQEIAALAAKNEVLDQNMTRSKRVIDKIRAFVE